MSEPTATGIYAQLHLAPGTLLAGRFRIEALLGVGGMGVVYRAHDTALDVEVAIKLLRPELAVRPDAFERFRQELLLARQVSSPHVVRIHDLAQHDGHWLISMDYVAGEGLDRRIGRGRLALDEAVQVARQIALGLQAAHARGVVHRDLKPANVLVDANGNAYISDFGIARSLASSGLTHAGVTGVIGTPDYLSPEQARGDRVDTRSDLYALGLILHEMLTGQPAFPSATAAEAIAQRLVRAPAPVTRERPELPGWIARLVERMLRPQPGHRLPTAGAVIQVLERRAMPRDLRPRRRSWLVLAALALVGAGIVLWRLPHRLPVIATVPSLHRVLILPLRSDALPAPRVAALDAYLREAVFVLPGVASVDSERTRQAVAQLDAAGNVPDPLVLQRLAVADRSLRVTLRQHGDRWQVHATLGDAGAAGQLLDGPLAADALTAFHGWLVQPALSKALGATAAATVPNLPSLATLDAFGGALQARDGGHYVAALDALHALTRTLRDDPWVWLTEFQLARMLGEHELASDALAQGQRAAQGASPRLQRVFAAERSLDDGDLPSAVAQWRAQLAQTPDDTLADLQLARAQGDGGDYRAAVTRLTRLSARDGGDPRIWFELGKASILQGEARRAVDDYLVRALVLFKRSRNSYGVATTANALGIGYGRLGQTADAEEQYRKAVQLQGEVGNQRGVATSLRNLANVLSLRGAFDEAGSALAQARKRVVALGDREGLAAVDNELGVLAEERGDYPEALQSYQRALQGWQQVDDPHGLAQALNDIGFAHYQLGHYDDAESYWRRAAESSAGLGDTGRVRVRQNLGLLAAVRGRWEQANTLQQSALAEAERQQMPEETAVSLRNLAELALLQADIGGALGEADKAITLFAERDDLRGQADGHLLRVQALLAAGADSAAERELKPYLATEPGASLEQRTRVQWLDAELALHAGRVRDAQAALDRARTLAAASGVRELQVRVALLRARIDPRDGAGLDDATRSLGNVPLRLDWLALAMERALADHQAQAALGSYREATQLMHGSAVLGAAHLHTLGARAQRMAGDEPAALEAERAAATAAASFRRQLPAELREVKTAGAISGGDPA